jgi:AcrR family transcriptional regulator
MAISLRSPRKTRARGRRKARGNRVPLTRERVLDSALAFVDRSGVEELSMRKLAAELNVEAMSLYNHVANKEAILAGVLDLVLSRVEIPQVESGEWQRWMRTFSLRFRDLFRRHPHLVAVLTADLPVGPAGLALMNRALQQFHDAGMNDELTHHAWHCVLNHLFGTLVQDRFESRVERAARELRAHDDVQLPMLQSLLRQQVRMEQCNIDAEFLFGLDLLLLGVEAERLRQQTPPAPVSNG